jgi:YidC/Oxa1 family membrane protein insertase
MERRFILFLVLAVALAVGNAWVLHKFQPPPVQKPEIAKNEPAEQIKHKPKDEVAVVETKPHAEQKKPAETKPAEAPEKPATTETTVPEQWATLGSVDPKSPYRMLATFTNRGAAVVRLELSNPKYRDLDDRGGYLGHLVMPGNLGANGCRVDVVGAGTPAAQAGLRVGDVIEQLDNDPIASGNQLNEVLRHKKPGQRVTLQVRRDGRPLELTGVELIRRPLEVVRPDSVEMITKPLEPVPPEDLDPLSFLLTLYQIDDEKLGEAERKLINNDREFPGVKLRTGTWTLAETAEDHVSFRRQLSKWGLEVTKTYRLEPIPQAMIADPNYQAYHLLLDIKIRNTGGTARKVAYQLDGPTGLPTEGYWYASKVAGSLRDVVVLFNHEQITRVDSSSIADDKIPVPWDDKEMLSFIGVDAQYFASVLMPQGDDPQHPMLARSQAIKVGKVDPQWKKTVDTSCRVVSRLNTLAPNGGSLDHQYLIFAGPKRPELVDQYQMPGLVDYGWFSKIATPMLWILHFFYGIVRNYGLAIIMLTVLVRLCMFPFSRKQAIGAQKMAQIQPELKKLQEKYKKDVEGMRKAQQELFRKHNYNPLSGCVTVIFQLPIFVALYRSLMVDVELRQAPLLTEAIRWCSNLAAPDMLFDWRAFMPEFITSGVGLLGLGPYFNLLPICTIFLFLWQQKKMMPPPADENAAMQQKVMKYMMVFMGLMFFKVASGLCLYFIASSLWGIAERKLLPKLQHPDPAASGAASAASSRSGNDAGGRNKKARRR